MRRYRCRRAKAAAARLASDPSVEYAEPDIMLKKLAIPNEPLFDRRQWNLFAPTSTFTGPVAAGALNRRQLPAAQNCRLRGTSRPGIAVSSLR